MNTPISKSGKQQGFSLLEVLIALIVIAIGMLGIGRMLLLSHKSNTSSFTRQQAVQSATNIIDRIRANRLAAISGSYNINNLVASGAPIIPTAPPTNCATSSCSTSALAAYDTWYWLSNDVAQLPNGCGSITVTPSGTSTQVTVTVQWDDSAAQGTFSPIASTPSQLIFETML